MHVHKYMSAYKHTYLESSIFLVDEGKTLLFH